MDSSSAVPVITVDGLSASGKGTIANAVALKLRWNLLDSGLLYRITGYLVSEYGIDFDDEEAIETLIRDKVTIRYAESGVTAEERGRDSNGLYILDDSLLHKQVWWRRQNITHVVRGNTVSKYASIVALSPRIRAVLRPKQREQRVEPGLVADGRDMGTIVFPDAQLKIFLQASLETRTHRRMAQLQLCDNQVNFSRTRQSLRDRDESDVLREVAPAKPASDAVQVDSSNLTIEQTVARVMDLANERNLISNI